MLELEILNELDPSKEFENKLEIMFINDLTHRYYGRRIWITGFAGRTCAG